MVTRWVLALAMLFLVSGPALAKSALQQLATAYSQSFQRIDCSGS